MAHYLFFSVGARLTLACALKAATTLPPVDSTPPAHLVSHNDSTPSAHLVSHNDSTPQSAHLVSHNDVHTVADGGDEAADARHVVRVDDAALEAHEGRQVLLQLQVHVNGAVEAAWTAGAHAVLGNGGMGHILRGSGFWASGSGWHGAHLAGLRVEGLGHGAHPAGLRVEGLGLKLA